MNSDLKESALEYAMRGWCVFPDHGVNEMLQCTCADPACRVQGKHPRDTYLKNEGSLSPAQIANWWDAWPDSNVAIVCGAKSGIVVIDIDEKNGGYASLARLERQRGALPKTVTVKSGGGGLHLYFQHPKRGEIRNRLGLYPGIDVKADKGRIVAPPSRHKSGTRYSWKEGFGPDEILLAEMPRWLLSAIAVQKGTGTPRAMKRVGLRF